MSGCGYEFEMVGEWEIEERDAQEERAEESGRVARMTPEEFGVFFAEHGRRSLDVDADFQFASDTFTIEDSIKS